MDSTALLQHLNVDELKDLLNDDGPKIEDMIKDDTTLKAMESERDNLIAINKSLAEYNLSKEPQFRQAKQCLVDSHKNGLDLRKEVEKKRDELLELSHQKSLDTTLALLQAATAEAEEESEAIASQFLSKEIPLDTFISSFIAKRRIAHLRRIKTDKLKDFVRDQSSNGHNSSSSNYSPVNQPVRPAPGPPLPYPTGSFAMPQPGVNMYNPYQQSPYNPR